MTDSGTPQAASKVWMRPLGNKCRIRLENQAIAEWLFSHVDSLPGLTKCEDFTSQPGCFTFNVPFSKDMTRSSLAKMLRHLTEVELMPQPA